MSETGYVPLSRLREYITKGKTIPQKGAYFIISSKAYPKGYKTNYRSDEETPYYTLETLIYWQKTWGLKHEIYENRAKRKGLQQVKDSERIVLRDYLIGRRDSVPGIVLKDTIIQKGMKVQKNIKHRQEETTPRVLSNQKVTKGSNLHITSKNQGVTTEEDYNMNDHTLCRQTLKQKETECTNLIRRNLELECRNKMLEKKIRQVKNELGQPREKDKELMRHFKGKKDIIKKIFGGYSEKSNKSPR
jgi:hypothetical protein